MTRTTDKLSVAFVCTGNICRSTMAEAPTGFHMGYRSVAKTCIGVFSHMVKELGLRANFDKIDSFGTTGYHVGDSPDYRTSLVLKQHGIQYSHRAQKISKQDFYSFDYLFCMDLGHLRSLKRLEPKDAKAKVLLFGEYNSSGSGLKTEVADPWYDSDLHGFETCYEQVTHFSKQFIKQHFNA